MNTEVQQKFIKSYARENSIPELEALGVFEKYFVDKTQILPLIQKPESDRYPDDGLSAVALAKINLEEKRLAAEDRRAMLDERRLQLEERTRDEQLRLDKERQREDALLNRWMMMGKGREEFAASEKLFDRLIGMREMADSKFERLMIENKNKPDAIQQMREYSQINKEMTENVFSAIENMGIDLSKIRGVMNLNKKAGAWDKLAEVAAPLIQKVTEAQQLKQQAPSGLDTNAAQGPPNALRLQEEAFVRAEVEKKARENELLRAELEKEKIKYEPWIDERNKLILKARELGISDTFDSISNEDLMQQIEIQEADREIRKQQEKDAARQAEVKKIEEKLQKQREEDAARQAEIKKNEDEKQRRELVEKAIDLGLPFDRDLSTEQLSKLILEEEIRREKELQEKEKKKVTETKPPKQSKKRSTRTKKVLQKFTVLHGNESNEIEAANARGAALKIAKILYGTKENPVIVTIDEKMFETYLDDKNRPHVRKIDRPVVVLEKEEETTENEEQKQEDTES